jgi:EmrB/QacA subfamily drug resistance transporter
MSRGSPAEGIALLTAAVASFLTPFMSSSLNIALPAIGAELKASALLLSWIPTAFLLAAAVFLVPFGRLADLYGRRRVFASGLAFFSASSLLCMLAPSAPILVLLRTLQGAGGAMIYATAVAIISAVIPRERRGRAIGINVAATYLGLSLGPVLGGILTEQLGWRSLFALTAALGLAALILVLLKLPADPARAEKEKFDIPGGAFFGLTLAAALLGLSRLPALQGVWYLTAAVGAALLFVRRELRAPSPLLNLRLFSANRVFAFSSLAALINYSATFAVGFLLSLYLQTVREMSPQTAGAVLLCQPLVMVIFSPLAGRLADTLEARWVASAGMALVSGGLLMLAFLDHHAPLLFIGASLAVLGLGFAFFSSPNTHAIMSAVPRDSYGIAAAVVGTMRLSGQMFSMGIAMLVLSIYLGGAPLTVESSGLFLAGSRVSFLIFAALCAAGIFASAARGRLHRHEPG